MSLLQRTIQREVSFSGTGLHCGIQINVTLRPAAAGVGIQFVRRDLSRDRFIAARANRVLDTQLATRLGSDESHSVATVEHFLAALFGFGVDNLIVELDGPEMPILDGSAAPFLALIDEAGVAEIPGSRRSVVVLRKTIEVVDPRDPTRFVRIEPARQPEIHYRIDFGQGNAIGTQSATLPWTGVAFCEHFSFARTFCFADEVEAMKKVGLARGGSLENAVVVTRSKGSAADSGLLNTHGLRDDVEFVKHKILDCVGDLMLVGHGVLGRVVAHKAGHDLHTRLAQVILEAVASGDGRAELVELGAAARAAASWQDCARFPKSLGEVRFAPGSLAFVKG